VVAPGLSEAHPFGAVVDAPAPNAASLAEVPRAVLDARGVSHRFTDDLVLDGVSLTVGAGEIHALLGPNGAGKTTLIRILAGLLHPTAGAVAVAGFSPRENPRLFRERIGFLPSGDRTFYLRISALENLVFFARLYGMRRREAVRRARVVLALVGLEDAEALRVAAYSHGMQKRLSVARALLTSPPVLLIDEATHDLDPGGARRVRELVASAAERGSSVVWATQRLDEIRGFADAVTLVHRGHVRFVGTVPQLMAHAVPRRFVVHLQHGAAPGGLAAALTEMATFVRIGGEDSEHYLLSLADGFVLGDALAALVAAGVEVLSCREERSELEEAFLRLTKSGSE
jgi:ABC-type multidrug transport system ATPase subunit